MFLSILSIYKIVLFQVLIKGNMYIFTTDVIKDYYFQLTNITIDLNITCSCSKVIPLKTCHSLTDEK